MTKTWTTATLNVWKKRLQQKLIKPYLTNHHHKAALQCVEGSAEASSRVDEELHWDNEQPESNNGDEHHEVEPKWTVVVQHKKQKTVRSQNQALSQLAQSLDKITLSRIRRGNMV